MSVVNIAVYKFAPLTELGPRRSRLQALCKEQRLRGTILLATEGINLFVAGDQAGIDALLDDLQFDAEIGPLEVKFSYSAHQPFNRMLVKVKREIIAFGIPVAVDMRGDDKISAEQLCTWLDDGREVILYDTRNEFEAEVGTFANAVTAGVDNFTDFPAAVDRLPTEWRERPIVTFCTGGIRCEKAAPLMRERGFRQVYQLEGGILKYFERVGGKHYRGDCFVFDQRVAVDAALRETNAAQCYACQTVLDEADQESPHYAVGEHCPYCYRTEAEEMAASIAAREARLRRLATPLPGSVPYTNRRPIYVASDQGGLSLINFLHAAVPALSLAEWRAETAADRVVLNGKPADACSVVDVGECYEHVTHNVVEPDANSNIRILYEDAALVVVDKPAPLPMHPSGRFNKNTLLRLLEPLYLPERLRVVHRLDANTSGVAILARTGRMAGRVQRQFEAGTVEKTYFARVHGVPSQSDFACTRRVAAEPVQAGVRLLDDDGLAAETRFRLVRTFDDGTSLIECQPITGRTNQIRLHLWSLGLPIVGDPTYLLSGRYAAEQTLSVDAPTMCLHAAKQMLKHPATGELVTFAAPLPSWAT